MKNELDYRMLTANAVAQYLQRRELDMRDFEYDMGGPRETWRFTAARDWANTQLARRALLARRPAKASKSRH
jgi:hypothetical protein